MLDTDDTRKMTDNATSMNINLPTGELEKARMHWFWLGWELIPNNFFVVSYFPLCKRKSINWLVYFLKFHLQCPEPDFICENWKSQKVK